MTPARTSILVAAARAFGSREPDEGTRNPDFLAGKLIGPDERALISEHPLSQVADQDYQTAKQQASVIGITWLMLMRTRFIDEALQRAVHNGATQIVILGAGFDTRAFRFRELLTGCRVWEVDTPQTQRYKTRRVREVLGEPPANLTYCEVDFATDDLFEALKACGFRETEKTFYIWEGVVMYLPEESVRATLRAVSAHSPPGSSLVLDYSNKVGLNLRSMDPQSNGDIFAKWGEPWIFGVPDKDGRAFFRELGFDPGVPLATTDLAVMKRYAAGSDGRVFGFEVFTKLRAEAEARAAAGNSADLQALEARRALIESGGTYWFAELTSLGGSRANATS